MGPTQPVESQKRGGWPEALRARGQNSIWAFNYNHTTMGLALNSKCSFNMTTKITFGPFLLTKLFNFWQRLNFKSICWPILKWECFEVKFSKLKNANQPIFLKIQIFEGIKLKMAESVHFYDRLMIPKWFLVLFHFRSCYCGFLFSNLRPILE